MKKVKLTVGLFSAGLCLIPISMLFKPAAIAAIALICLSFVVILNAIVNDA